MPLSNIPNLNSPEIIFNIEEPVPVAFDMEKFVRTVFNLKDITCGFFEFNFVNADMIVSLNQSHLGRDYVTDIITFNLGSSEDIVGDVYICVEQASENAAHYKHDFEDEIRLLLIHGILHLLDYQDYTDEEKQIMDVEQTRLLQEAKTWLLRNP